MTDKTEKKLNVEVPKWAKDLAIKESKLAKSISENFLGISKMFPDFSKMIPDFSGLVPKMNIPIVSPSIDSEIISEIPRSPFSISEENNWERHNNIMDMQNKMLGVNKSILSEQVSTFKLTKRIFWLTLGTLVVTFIAIGIAVYNLMYL